MIAGSIDPPSQIPARYLLISYPLSVMWALSSFHGKFFRERAMQKIQSASQSTGSPILLLMGDRDQFTGLNAFKKWIGDNENDFVKVRIIPGADHFWFGKEDVLEKIVDSWLRS
jgi:alpha/beta superfamily hydrolase